MAWFGLAVCVFVVGLLATATLREPPSRGAGPGRPRPSMRAVFGSASVWQLGLVFMFYGVAYVTYGTFFAAHLARDAGLASDEIGRLWSLAGVVGLGGGILSGALSDRLGPRLTLMLLFVGQAIAEVTLALGQSPPLFLFSALLYGLTVWCFAAVVSAACALAVGPRLAPAAVSLAVVMMSIGQLSGPILGGLLADRFGSFSPALLLATAADVLGIVACAGMRLRRFEGG
jgi:predicted MFS family arabinose efflux permease